MHLEYLKIFTDLGRWRSFSQTAQMNNISQSAVSHVVSQLEKRLGAKLVDRSVRPLQLTDSGRIFCEGCRNVVEQFQQLEASIRKADLLAVSAVRVAAIYSVGLLNMNQYVERFSAEHPGTEVRLEYLHPSEVYERVLGGSADFGLVSYPRKTRELALLPWRNERMFLACPPAHKLARLPALRLSQLRGERYVGFTRDLAIRQRIDRLLRKKGISVEIVLEFDNIECVKRAIEAGNGVALLPEPMLTREAQAGTLGVVPLAGCRLVRPLSIVYRRSQKLTPSARSFIDLIRHSEKGGTERNSSRTRKA